MSRSPAAHHSLEIVSRVLVLLLPAFALALLLGSCAAAGGPAVYESEKAAAVPATPEPAVEPEGAAGAAAEAMPAEAEGAVAQAAERAEREAAAEAGTVRYLSADDSNSAASPVIARKLIAAGRYVQPALVRTYEFLNYYTFDYPPPRQAPVSVDAQMRPTGQPGAYSLQVAVRSAERRLADMPPLHLIVLLDVSGSMVGEPLDLGAAVLRGLAQRLRPQDRLSLVTCNRQARVVFEGQSVEPGLRSRLEAVLGSLRADDITDLEKGVLLAYEVASRNYDYRVRSRVVVISDGADNAGTNAVQTISRHAEDSDRQGIYLAGIGVGEGFDDSLMDRFTDKGRGAYLFLDSPAEVANLLEERRFVAAFDLAVKDVRLKMVMPPGWRMEEFHGEQVSAVASEVTPQYLSPNDQMIYHLVVATDNPPGQALAQQFTFEAEFRPLPGSPQRESITVSVEEMLDRQDQIRKGDAVVAYAEMLKQIAVPLEQNRQANLEALARAREQVEEALRSLRDPELAGILALLERYQGTLERGEQFPGSRDRDSEDPAAVLGIPADSVRRTSTRGPNTAAAIRALGRLNSSQRLVPLEGYRFLALSSGPVGNPMPAGAGELSGRVYPDPAPEFMGSRRTPGRRMGVYDLHQVRLELVAPPNARSFSFDFNFFSAEYPQYVNQNFNDTFYAILEAPSTNGGRPTNICFDANNNSIEVDNNYFQQPFHPIPNTGTGFDSHGSTGWLRTSWPVRGGERISLSFSIHDEGDAVFDSLVLLDNFRWHAHEAVGTTDPLN